MARAKLTTIGRAEYLQFVGQANAAVPAKVDTGADSSSVWASNIRLDRDDLVFVLFDPSSIYYTGEEIRVPSGQYREVIVENSFGNKETRYGAKLAVRIKGRRV